MKMKKLIALLTATVMVGAMAVGCSAPAEEAPAEETATAEEAPAEEAPAEEATEEAPAADVSGVVALSGSTSMEKLVKTYQETILEVLPDVELTAEFVGSSAGVEQVLSGTVDVGNASRNLKDSEVEAGAVENIVAIDGIAVVVDTANEVANISMDDLVAIYTGEITNWSDVEGGADQPIVVIGREAGSGTRGAFEEILGVEDACEYASELDSTGTVMAQVSATPGAIGYVSLDALNDTVKALSYEGVEVTADNIKAGTYTLSRPFVMATNGPIEEQSDVVQAFFDYVFSAEGQAIVAQVGLVPVN